MPSTNLAQQSCETQQILAATKSLTCVMLWFSSLNCANQLSLRTSSLGPQ